MTSREAHALTTEAYKLNTSEAHDEAAKAHGSLAWATGLCQSARGNHIFQAEKHGKLADHLRRQGK